MAGVHAIREELMAEYRHDFRALMADMMRRQKLSGRKLVTAQPGRPRVARKQSKVLAGFR